MTKYTPTLNLPYPQESDPPRGWEQIQNLATAVETATVARTKLPNGDFIVGELVADLYFGKFVVLSGVGAHPTASTGGVVLADSVLTTLPAALRPAVLDHYSIAVDGNVPVRVDIYPDGRVVLASDHPVKWFALGGVSFTRGAPARAALTYNPKDGLYYQA